MDAEHKILPAVTQSFAHARAACAQQARNKLADFRTAIILALSVSYCPLISDS